MRTLRHRSGLQPPGRPDARREVHALPMTGPGRRRAARRAAAEAATQRDVVGQTIDIVNEVHPREVLRGHSPVVAIVLDILDPDERILLTQAAADKIAVELGKSGGQGYLALHSLLELHRRHPTDSTTTFFSGVRNKLLKNPEHDSLRWLMQRRPSGSHDGMTCLTYSGGRRCHVYDRSLDLVELRLHAPAADGQLLKRALRPDEWRQILGHPEHLFYVRLHTNFSQPGDVLADHFAGDSEYSGVLVEIWQTDAIGMHGRLHPTAALPHLVRVERVYSSGRWYESVTDWLATGRMGDGRSIHRPT